MIHRVSDGSFAREVLLSAEPVLVTFVADDCGPCRTVMQSLEQFAHEMQGHAKVVKVDVDQSPESRTRYDIHGLPTLILFMEGEIAARRIGAVIETDELKAWFSASVRR